MSRPESAVLAGLALDGTDERVVETAEEVARAFGASIWLVHVAAPDPDFVGLDVGPQVVRDARASELHEEHRELQESADEIRARGLEATALLVQGPTAATLLDEAERRRASWIVLGSRGRSRLGRALLGSVCDGVLRRAGVPVVIVPPEREDPT